MLQVWIDVLSQAGIPVEVCHVHEQGEKPKGRGKKVKQEVARKRKRSDSEPVEALFVESEDEPEAECHPPQTPRTGRIVDRVEVLITAPSPKKRRLQSSQSP